MASEACQPRRTRAGLKLRLRWLHPGTFPSRSSPTPYARPSTSPRPLYVTGPEAYSTWAPSRVSLHLQAQQAPPTISHARCGPRHNLNLLQSHLLSPMTASAPKRSLSPCANCGLLLCFWKTSRRCSFRLTDACTGLQDLPDAPAQSDRLMTTRLNPRLRHNISIERPHSFIAT